MKTTVKLFMIAVAFLISGNLFAQSIQGPSLLGEPTNEQLTQVRKYAIELCRDFYNANLSQDNLSKLNSYVDQLKNSVDGLPAYVPGAVENYVLANRNSSPLAQRYIKCQAIIAFPEAFNMTEQGLTDIDKELQNIAAEISQIK